MRLPALLLIAATVGLTACKQEVPPGAPTTARAPAPASPDASALPRTLDPSDERMWVKPGRAVADPAGGPTATAQEIKLSRCPPEMAPTPIGGCIDRFEASAARGSPGGADGRGTTLVAISVAGQRPIHGVSRAQAEKACANAGKRLCTEKEWKAACWGRMAVNLAFNYPYQTAFEGGRCNDWIASAEGKKGVAAAGAFSRCVTPQGVHDLAGNVGEWIASPETGDRYALRGGSYRNVAADTACESDDVLARALDQPPVAGVRCCRDGLDDPQTKR